LAFGVMCALTVFYYVGNREKERLKLIFNISLGSLLSLLQTFAVMLSMRIDWPETVQMSTRGMELTLVDVKVMRPSCIWGDGFTNFIMALLLPTAILGCLGILHLICLVPSIQMALKIDFDKTFLFIGACVQMFFISMVSINTALFECTGSPNGRSVVRSFGFAECGSAEHMTVLPLAIMGLLLYVLVPASVLVYFIVKAPYLW